MENILRNKYLARIRPYYESNLIKAITGVRRCGKSVILSQIIDEIRNSVDSAHIIIIDLESIEGRKINTCEKLENKISNLIKDKDKYYIFIDEIQNIKNFEVSLAAIRVSFNCSIFVTGSNSKLLSGKLQDKLTGRAKEFEVLPFTFSEYIEFKQMNHLPIDYDDDFMDYLKFGGMPQRFNESNEMEVRRYLKGIFESIIEKDVFGTHKKINKNEFKRVANYVLSESGKSFSSMSAAKALERGISNEEARSKSITINNYLDYLTECYLITECQPHYQKGKERLNGKRKYYPVDTGMKNSLGAIVDIDETFSLEGVIYNELISRGYEVFYEKLRDGEIDFTLVNGNKKCFIQVSYYMENESTLNREYGAFDKVRDNSPKYVFSLDKKDTSRNGITHINIIDFLLNKVDLIFS
ncbi:MAG: ATP-binding protein [Bacillales bacterium]|nr:ATP-binding protein [Bacillales bacterium]